MDSLTTSDLEDSVKDSEPVDWVAVPGAELLMTEDSGNALVEDVIWLPRVVETILVTHLWSRQDVTVMIVCVVSVSVKVCGAEDVTFEYNAELEDLNSGGTTVTVQVSTSAQSEGVKVPGTVPVVSVTVVVV